MESVFDHTERAAQVEYERECTLVAMIMFQPGFIIKALDR